MAGKISMWAILLCCVMCLPVDGAEPNIVLSERFTGNTEAFEIAHIRRAIEPEVIQYEVCHPDCGQPVATIIPGEYVYFVEGERMPRVGRMILVNSKQTIVQKSNELFKNNLTLYDLNGIPIHPGFWDGVKRDSDQFHRLVEAYESEMCAWRRAYIYCRSKVE